jgi:hypothetical protein
VAKTLSMEEIAEGSVKAPRTSLGMPLMIEAMEGFGRSSAESAEMLARAAETTLGLENVSIDVHLRGSEESIEGGYYFAAVCVTVTVTMAASPPAPAASSVRPRVDRNRETERRIVLDR